MSNIPTEFRYLIIALIIFSVAYLLSRLARFVLKKSFERAAQRIKVDPTNYHFLLNMVSLIIFIGACFALFYTIPQLKALGMTFFAGAGIVSIIIGFASQQALSNIISGILIVIFKPFRVGDVIEIQGKTGYIEDITLRHVVVKSFENKRVIIPNTVISSETITNWNIVDNKACNFVEMGISYDSDVDKAMTIMQEEGMAHPHFIDNRTRAEKKTLPAIVVRVISFGDSSVNLRAYVWTSDPIKGFELKTDLYKSIKARFDKEGIEIPFPYRTIVYKNPPS